MRSPKFILVLAIILSIIIAIWGIFLNKSVLTITSEIIPFQVDAGELIPCEKSPCQIKLKPKTYTVTVSKDRYTEQTFSIDLLTNRNEKIEYTPAQIPNITEFPEFVAPYKFTFLIQENGEQLVRLRPWDGGLDTVLTRFASPLANPKAVASPDHKKVVVYSDDGNWLVDTTTKTKQPLTEIETNPKSLNFLTNSKLLYEEETTKLLDLDTMQISDYPFIKPEHVVYTSENSAYILSQADLGNSGETQEGEINFLSLIKVTGEDFLKDATNQNYSLYSFDQNKFTKLLEVDKQKFPEPYILFLSDQDELGLQPTFQDGERFYLITF